MPEASILMRSKNDVAYIHDSLSMISRQTFQDFELLNIDSGSSDGTFEIIRDVNPSARQIPPDEYNPGWVLNGMASKARGKFLVFLNSDATPTDETWLDHLLAPLRRSPQVAATFGRQVARGDAHPLVQRDYLVTYGRRSAPARFSWFTIGNDSWFHLFSLANAAMRRSCWVRRPFSTAIQYSEDIEWAHWAQGNGSQIEYVPKAVVVHSHNYSYRQAWARHFEEGRAEAHIFGNGRKGPNHFLAYAVLPYLSALLRDLVFCQRQQCLRACLQSPRLRYAQKFGRYFGYRTGLAERVS